MADSTLHRLGLTVAIFAAVWAITLPAPCQTPTTADQVAFLRDHADKGDAESQYYLGLSYAEGDGVPQDSVEAVKWLRKSAEQGDADGQVWLGHLLRRALAP